MSVSARRAFARHHDPDVLLLRWALPALGLAWLAAHLVDAPLARLLFEWEGGHWALRQHWLLEDIVHRGGRAASLLAWLSLLAATVLCWRQLSAQAWIRPAARLLLATLASTLVVAWLKSATHMDCPWDLSGYGGDRPFVPLFATRPQDLGQPACFPAAHAASGYAWVALYFFFAQVQPRWRWAGLGIGLLAGMLFGIAQQLRGAHFLSHDIASLAVCWAVAGSVEGAARWRRGRTTAGATA
jgi:membrane-associated PAP2 superfamily phosphatase